MVKTFILLYSPSMMRAHGMLTAMYPAAQVIVSR